MRISLIAMAALLAGCAQQASLGSQSVARAPVICEPGAVLNEGRHARMYPANCPQDPALINRYNLGSRIAFLEEELREVNYLIASRDGRGPIGSVAYAGRFVGGFGSRGYLLSRRSDIKDELRFRRREAGLNG